VELIDAAGMRQVRMTSLRQRRVAWRPDQAALTDGPPKRPTKAEAGHYGLRATGYGLRDGHYDRRRHRTIEHRDGPLRVGQAIA
jgi:hypothetical protein